MMKTFLFVVAAVLSLSTPALAGDKADEARKHFNRSKELYEDGDFAAALNELERSYAAVPNFKLLYNMGQIQSAMQNYSGALKSFRRFLLEGGSDVAESRRAEVLKEVDKLRTRVAELTVIAPEGAELAVDDVVVGRAPLPEALTVNAGRRRLTATLADHFPLTRVVEVAGLDTQTVRLELQRVVAAAPTAASPVPNEAAVGTTAKAAPARPLPAWIPWIGVGLLAAATATTGALALSSSGSQAKLIDTFGSSRAAIDAAVSKTRSLALVTDVLAGTTAAAAIGALLYTLLKPADPEPTVMIGVSSQSVVLTGAF
jgi:hypothetical protein